MIVFVFDHSLVLVYVAVVKRNLHISNMLNICKLHEFSVSKHTQKLVQSPCEYLIHIMLTVSPLFIHHTLQSKCMIMLPANEPATKECSVPLCFSLAPKSPPLTHFSNNQAEEY